MIIVIFQGLYNIKYVSIITVKIIEIKNSQQNREFCDILFSQKKSSSMHKSVK